ncbi:MAG: ABC transporter permease [Clostridia bacterium]|nr:ABC transporter permease [Clostridia bacterium]
MAEAREVASNRGRKIRRMRHRGRSSQVSIYLGKQLRFFINENDWKVLPMAAIIAALVGMVIRKRFFINMEGSLIGAFALTCVAIWNGCFNSIQAVCRERPIIKREHRSGMHITSYVAAHMIYQFLLCLAQTGLTIYVLMIMQVRFPEKGFITPFMPLDIGITMLLITYAADMMSLFLSSISHTTTGAMTIMPFALIFQLVFSGGVIPLPEWSQSLSDFTISNYGIKALASQSGYNERPMVTAWQTLEDMRDDEVGGDVTLGRILDILDSKPVQDRRDLVLIDSTWLDQTLDMEEGTDLPEEAADPSAGPEAGAADPSVSAETGEADAAAETVPVLTVGQLVDSLKEFPALQANRDRIFTLKAKVSDLFEMFGEENLKQLVQRKTAEANYKEEYEMSRTNIAGNWFVLGLYILFFALISVIALEFIDKDKR